VAGFGSNFLPSLHVFDGTGADSRVCGSRFSDDRLFPVKMRHVLPNILGIKASRGSADDKQYDKLVRCCGKKAVLTSTKNG
jgi:hypothetical protein